MISRKLGSHHERVLTHLKSSGADIRIFRGNQFHITAADAINSNDINTLRPRKNGRRFADDTFKRIFLNENVRISIKIFLKFVPNGPMNNNPVLVQIMAWRRSDDKPLSEPMMVNLLTHICVTLPQWVNCVGSTGPCFPLGRIVIHPSLPWRNNYPLRPSDAYMRQ